MREARTRGAKPLKQRDMAIIKSVLGKISGRVGNTIVYEVKGQTRMRAEPLHVKNPRTPRQVAHRNKVRGIADLYYSTDMRLRGTFDRATADTLMNGYNLFLKRNLKALDKEGQVGDPAKLCLAAGVLPLPSSLSVETSEDGTVRFAWGELCNPDWNNSWDKLQVAAYGECLEEDDDELYLYLLAKDIAPAHKHRCEWRLPENTPRPVWLYGFFSNEVSGKGTDSFLIGKFD